MEYLETEQLGDAIRKLIELCNRYRESNIALQKENHQLIIERDELLRKNDVARHKIETLLETLQAQEVSA